MRTIEKRVGKIHFVHHLEKSYAPANLGDWIASPYSYFKDFFSRYTCVLHSGWAILWHEIEKDDVVIVGGGGLLDNSDALNAVINRIIDKCDNVIIWGAGTHRYSDNNIFGKSGANTPISFEKALLCGIRDYKHPWQLPFVPCASCMHPAFSADKGEIKVEREIGTIRSALESSFAVSDLPSSISNGESIGAVVNYILSSKIILVSSYHGAFWSQLLGRKVILPASRLGVDKYRYFKNPVGFYEGTKFDDAKLLEIASEIPEPTNFLEEARNINYEFFNKVRNIIEEKIPVRPETETIQILSKRVAQLEFTLIDVWNYVRKMNSRVEKMGASDRG